MIFDVENWLWKSNFGTFWHLPTSYIDSRDTIDSFEYVDSWAEIFLILYPMLENLTTVLP